MYHENSPSPTSPDYERYSSIVWKDSAWTKNERSHWSPKSARPAEVVPAQPFRLLEAPGLRDDYYCSPLAYCYTLGVLAVALGHQVYVWAEEELGLPSPPFGHIHPSNYVRSLSFSSQDGQKSILAIGRQRGHLSLWSARETTVRFEIGHPYAVTCVSFKPKSARRPSERFPDEIVSVEELVVGDEMGVIWLYSVEWPEIHEEQSWTGSMTLLAKIHAHTQQICGMAWSPDGQFLATGANDNACLLFELDTVVGSAFKDTDDLLTPSADPAQGRSSSRAKAAMRPPMPAPLLNYRGSLISGKGRSVLVPACQEKYCFLHSAAVKAIAFAPWQPSLLATGGGSHDRAIHFWHTRTGTCLATIDVLAQVTSLIWSTTRREIAATFGYATPDHPIRIAVFAWPSCAQISAIPQPIDQVPDEIHPSPNYRCIRALWAISYPGWVPRLDIDVPKMTPPPASRSPSPSPIALHTLQNEDGPGQTRTRSNPRSTQPRAKEGGTWCSRTVEEGCIVVACSDQRIKFHEIWTNRRLSFGMLPSGNLGGSDILEGIEGIETSASEIIR
ncbi:Uncharacterized protein PECH_008100 [Penicillium ucsense]|uniref:Anaphase-promoting complex subunit 4 WD40 domain-containing protein n=1 Tax=Penicillium ucsense TaxID=2839758 RepID=A0A8J8WNB8_9EURO|nr:Uncharacterized protein PECM_003346 [Penicillium ucsense]KAF7738734.1 Uncharacterized protein PECH_008100 [Penicillium ucsense]